MSEAYAACMRMRHSSTAVSFGANFGQQLVDLNFSRQRWWRQTDSVCCSTTPCSLRLALPDEMVDMPVESVLGRPGGFAAASLLGGGGDTAENFKYGAAARSTTPPTMRARQPFPTGDGGRRLKGRAHSSKPAPPAHRALAVSATAGASSQRELGHPLSAAAAPPATTLPPGKKFVPQSRSTKRGDREEKRHSRSPTRAAAQARVHASNAANGVTAGSPAGDHAPAVSGAAMKAAPAVLPPDAEGAASFRRTRDVSVGDVSVTLTVDPTRSPRRGAAALQPAVGSPRGSAAGSPTASCEVAMGPSISASPGPSRPLPMTAVASTALAHAYIALERLVPADVALRQRLRSARCFREGSSPLAVSRGYGWRSFEDLVEMFKVLLLRETLSRPDRWLNNSRLWQMVLLQDADGSFAPSRSLAQALLAMRTGAAAGHVGPSGTARDSLPRFKLWSNMLRPLRHPLTRLVAPGGKAHSAGASMAQQLGGLADDGGGGVELALSLAAETKCPLTGFEAEAISESTPVRLVEIAGAFNAAIRRADGGAGSLPPGDALDPHRVWATMLALECLLKLDESWLLSEPEEEEFTLADAADSWLRAQTARCPALASALRELKQEAVECLDRRAHLLQCTG